VADQKLHCVLETRPNRFLRVASVALFLTAGLAGCAEEPVPTAPLGFVAGALNACSGGASTLSEATELQVVVQNSQGVITFDQRVGFSGSGSVKVEDVPEGPDETVTLFGYSGEAKPAWFGRQRNVLIQKGAGNPAAMALGRFGGFSCPSGDNEYTHRMFPSATAIGQGLFFIAGGLTTVALGGTTRFATSDSSRKAFIYNSTTGDLSRVSSLMATGRGAHAAVLVRGSEKNRVVIYGGTNALTHNPAQENQFAWAYDIADAHSTVEVFEWEVGTDPANGVFVDFGTDVPQMFRKRVFPLAHVISTDGLVLTCGGGPWGLAQKPEGYVECDVWDAAENDFLPDTLSNNFMAQYRAGAAVAPIQSGEVTKLLIVGGVTEGPTVEIYTSSSNQRDGVGGSFINKDVPGPPHSFFHSLTPIGDNEFMLVGGVAWNGIHFDPPADTSSWKLSVNDDSSTVTVTAEGVPGLAFGRYFHAAAAPDGDRLVVLGGFTSNELEPTSDIRHFQSDAGWVGAPEDEGAFNARGAMGYILLDNDAILLLGGINAKADLQADEAGALEVYTPSNLLPL
jgi:hypothetical protein